MTDIKRFPGYASHEIHHATVKCFHNSVRYFTFCVALMMFYFFKIMSTQRLIGPKLILKQEVYTSVLIHSAPCLEASSFTAPEKLIFFFLTSVRFVGGG